MSGSITADIRDQLHNTHSGYIAAVCNAAYIVVKQSTDMIDEILALEDPERLVQFLDDSNTLEDDNLDNILNDDIKTLDYLANEVVPEIVKTYGVIQQLDGSTLTTLSEDEVTTDICLLIDFYSYQMLLGDLVS